MFCVTDAGGAFESRVRPQMLWTGSFPERHHIASNSSQKNPILKQAKAEYAKLQWVCADDSAERHFLVWAKSTDAILLATIRPFAAADRH
jgi:hypothetical protein